MKGNQPTWDSAAGDPDGTSSFKLSPWISSASWESSAKEGKELWSLYLPKSPKKKKLPADLLNMAFLSKPSQRGTRRAPQSSRSLLNEEGLQYVALGISTSQRSTLVQKHRFTRPLLCSKDSDKKEKSKHFPWPSRRSTIRLKHPFPTLVSASRHPLSIPPVH